MSFSCPCFSRTKHPSHLQVMHNQLAQTCTLLKLSKASSDGCQGPAGIVFYLCFHLRLAPFSHIWLFFAAERTAVGRASRVDHPGPPPDKRLSSWSALLPSPLSLRRRDVRGARAAAAAASRAVHTKNGSPRVARINIRGAARHAAGRGPDKELRNRGVPCGRASTQRARVRAEHADITL